MCGCISIGDAHYVIMARTKLERQNTPRNLLKMESFNFFILKFAEFFKNNF